MTGRIRTEELTGPLGGSVAFPGGMTFPNRTLGNNVLDWYEEGTFDPIIEGQTTAGTATYIAGNRFGSYVRIGNICVINFRVEWSAHSGSGQLKIRGLPYYPSTGGQPLGTFTQSTGAVPLGMQKVAGFCWMHGNGAVYVNSASAWASVSLASSGAVICSAGFITG